MSAPTSSCSSAPGAHRLRRAALALELQAALRVRDARESPPSSGCGTGCRAAWARAWCTAAPPARTRPPPSIRAAGVPRLRRKASSSTFSALRPSVSGNALALQCGAHLGEPGLDDLGRRVLGTGVRTRRHGGEAQVDQGPCHLQGVLEAPGPVIHTRQQVAVQVDQARSRVALPTGVARRELVLLLVHLAIRHAVLLAQPTAEVHRAAPPRAERVGRILAREGQPASGRWDRWDAT